VSSSANPNATSNDRYFPRRSVARQLSDGLELPGAPKVVAAFDKFRGTATAEALCAVVGDAAWEHGWSAALTPLADGGEGTLTVLSRSGAVVRTAKVTGPLGEPIEAKWLLRGATAYIEMALASGLTLAGGRESNDPLDASTIGTGQLIAEAATAGAKRIVVTVGGSATTDGGLGALRAMEPLARFRGIEFVVACDVETTFVDAARVFGPQKGASPAQVNLLTGRLERLADDYLAARGINIRDLPGGGAAGGLAGGLASIGATITSGFSLIAEEVGLFDAIEGATLVITGEGYCDEESFDGKVVGGVCALAAEYGVPVVVIAGDIEPGLVVPEKFRGAGVTLISLTTRFGPDRSLSDPTTCVRELTNELLTR
jgi:glycerate 2-kinase